jgi:MSHA biogenesis protein MshL
VFDLNYADPDDVKEQVSTILTPGAGKIIVDKRSSKIIISDLSSKIEKIKKLVKSIDEESRQVFIEADIIQITLNDEFQQGIDWEKFFNVKNVDGLDFIGKFSFSSSESTYQKVTMGTVERDRYTSTLQFLQTYGDIKILSRPRLAVLNNQEAKILVGSREAYVTQTLSQAEATTVTSESVEFVDVGVKLNVVPTINKDGFITIKIKPEVSSVRETLETSLGSVIPIVETSESETVVKVKDGTVIMIAGLMKEEKRNETSGIPVLSKLPFIGGLFGKRDISKKNTEIIVFLTPHLMRGDTTLANTEIEKFIPKDIMPQDMKDALIKKEIEKIKARPLGNVPLMPLVKEEVSSKDKEITQKIKKIKGEK